MGSRLTVNVSWLSVFFVWRLGGEAVYFSYTHQITPEHAHWEAASNIEYNWR